MCALQETEIGEDFPEEILNSSEYNIELELNTTKKRVGFYIRRDTRYKRRNDLERKNLHIIIIDIMCDSSILRVINLYRSFRPPGFLSANEFFKTQLDLIGAVSNENCIVMGDFNLDARMAHNQDYPQKALLEILNNLTLEKNLMQIVDFTTWTRSVKGNIKQSLLDHVYVSNFAIVENVDFVVPTFGDHLLVKVELILVKNCYRNVIKIKRAWSKYSPESLCKKLNYCNLLTFSNQCNDANVQEHWNVLENVIVTVIDSLAPIVTCENVPSRRNDKVPREIKSKINLRKTLLKKYKSTGLVATLERVRFLNKEILTHFRVAKRNLVRSPMVGNGVPGLWKAVRLSKDLSPDSIPLDLKLGGNPIPLGNRAECFAKHFIDKVKVNVNKTKVDKKVYNGKNKLIVGCRDFMKKSDVKECLTMLKSKRCEGYDRIPVCALVDSKEILLDPLFSLFSKIYKTKQIPEQWKISKIVPIHKKGPKDCIENYRPVANLCSASKIFEKLILKQIHYLESTNKLDLTGKQQHGFKKNKSTATVGTLLQSLIARAADENCYVVMASLDLSMAFDLVNIELLLKRLGVMGFPSDLIALIGEWLTGRKFYVQVEEECSAWFDIDIGTIQGSVLGPVLYALFVSPLFDICQLTNFADDNFCLEWNTDLELLIVNLEKKLEMITKWLRDSGLVVNESKTEICLFHKKDQPSVNIRIDNVLIKSKKSMNVLGVVFDSKLTWNDQIAHCISKAKKALFALRLLRKFFNNNEMRTLLDSNFYSVLYYNAIIWLTPELNANLKHNLLTISSNALRSCLMQDNREISFENLHVNAKKCTPCQIMKYQSALNLHRILNQEVISFEIATVLNQMICTRRQTMFELARDNQCKIGMNTTANKLYHISGKISLLTLNNTFVHYKKLMKIQFLKNGKT